MKRSKTPIILNGCLKKDDFINLNATDATFASVSTDITPHNCTRAPLPVVSFNEF